MSEKSKYLNRISRYFIPGALAMFMAYGIGSGYLSTASSGSELGPGIQDNAPMTDPGPVDPYRPELKDVFFDRNSSRIRDDAKPVLDENAQVLRDESDIMYVVVESYCDSREESPARLGMQRGDAVRDYM
ncbi:MAG: OmpA family protein, partial [Candidatus Dadabacteria bacterium]